MITAHHCLLRTALILSLFLALVHPTDAEIPRIISYQGKVTDAGGTPVADGSYNMRFRIYDDVTAGTLYWDSGTQSVPLSGGTFNVHLGQSPMPSILAQFDEDYWLRVTFNGVDQVPRQPLVSTGYAFMASGLVPGTESEGSVTISPYAVFKGVNTAATGARYGLYGVSESNAGIGVCGEVTATSGATFGVWGKTASTIGRGVYGFSSATTGLCYGVIGYVESSEGYGVWGWSVASTGDTRGVYGSCGSPTGTGVYGLNGQTSGFGYGVAGVSASTQGTGVYGEVTNTDGVPNAGHFEASGVHAWGVLGQATGTGFSHGVVGECASTIGGGVYGEGPLYGVEGRASDTAGITSGGTFSAASSSGRGVTGLSDFIGGRFKDLNSNNYGYVGYDTYKIYGTGTVDFVQNHPNREDLVITYSAPEGNEAATYTRGTGRLTNGEARIALDETFAWVTNPSIGLTAHLTPRGTWADLYVKTLSTSELVVASHGGSGDTQFDYLVYGLRIGFEETSVVQEKQEESYIPSMKSHRDLYGRRPDLREYNAFERFKRMREEIGETQALDLSGADHLKAAIQEYDPAIHGPAEPDEHADLKRRLREERRRVQEEQRRIRSRQFAPREDAEPAANLR